jgi:hypothetical protein
MLSPIPIMATLLAVLSIVLFIAGIFALRKKRFFGGAASFVFGLLLLSSAGLFGTITIATQGYRALTHEEVAAVVQVEPVGSQRFHARFQFPDGRQAVFYLFGDALYVDAHILKWRPMANLFGLHTGYELDRVMGRYTHLQDEQTKPRTVFAISRKKLLDMFNLRWRYSLLRPLLDAEYGSATFMAADKPAHLEVRVSTTGLLIRQVE